MRRITIIVAILATLCCTGSANAAPLPREPGSSFCVQTRNAHSQRCDYRDKQSHGQRPSNEQEHSQRMARR